MSNALMKQKSYDPNRFIDALVEKLGLKNDAALCRVLCIQPPLISKIRHRHLPIGATLLLHIHELTNLSIGELREMMGDRRRKYRV